MANIYLPNFSVLCAISSLLFFCSTTRGFPVREDGSANEARTRGLLTPRLSRQIRQAGILPRTYDFSFCSQGVTLTLGRKPLNRANVRLTSFDAAELSDYLHGFTLEDRMDVWCKTANLAKVLAKSVDINIHLFSVHILDAFEGDILLATENVDRILGIGIRQHAPSLRPDSPNIRKREALKTWYEDMTSAVEDVRARKKRKTIVGQIFEWPNQKVDWRFDPNAAFTQFDKTSIRDAINYWEINTCFRFQEHPNQKPRRDHVKFVKGRGCTSFIGKLTGRSNGQEVSIGDGCQLLGIVAHEIAHAIGFYHEQARPDRDQYVEVLSQNIGIQFLGNFLKQSWFTSDTAGIPYDYGSAMHYAPFDFTRDRTNPKLTLRAKAPNLGKTMGQREGLSFYDFKAANFKYCSRVCGFRSLEWDRCQNGGYRDPTNCGVCKCQSGFAPPFCESVASHGNVDCGQQVMQATLGNNFMETPNYLQPNSGHPPNSGCAFFIQAPVDHVIEFEFVGEFGMQVPRPESLPCEDGYIEVRTVDIVRNGPRFCTARPSGVLVSDGPEMLVRTRTSKTMLTGFRARYRAVRRQCGGCVNGSATTADPCFKTREVDCSIDSPNRQNSCFQSMPECCTGFQMVNGGTECTRIGVDTTTTTTTTTTTAPPPTTTTTTTPTPTTTTTTTPRPTTTTTPSPTTTTTTTTTPTPTTTTTTTPTPTTTTTTTTTPTPTTTTTTTTPTPSTTTTTTTTPTPTTTTTTTPTPTTTTTTTPTPTTTTTTTPTPTTTTTTTPTTTTTTTTPTPTTTTTTTTTPTPTTTTTTTTTPTPTTTTTTTPTPTTTTTTQRPTTTTTVAPFVEIITPTPIIVTARPTTTTTAAVPTTTVAPTTTTTTTVAPTTTTTTTTAVPTTTTLATTVQPRLIVTTAFPRPPTRPGFPFPFTFPARPSEIGWGPWRKWGTCSKDCGNCGIEARTRKCAIPPCSGHSTQVRSCPSNPCFTGIPRTQICIDRTGVCNWWLRSSSFSQGCIRTKICVKVQKACCSGSVVNGLCRSPTLIGKRDTSHMWTRL